MDCQKFLGYNINDVIPILENAGINYDLIELLTPKKEKIGDDIRIVKIEEGQRLSIYVSYF